MSLNAATIDGLEAARPTETRWKVWAGRVISAQPIIALLVSAFLKLTHHPMMVELMAKLGYSEDKVTVVGLLALGSALVYAVPATSVLGAVLITGYFGGAIATHLRVSGPLVIPLVLGVLAWLGLYLRDPRLGKLLPSR